MKCLKGHISFPFITQETFRKLQPLHKMWHTQLTLFELKWPVHDHVIVLHWTPSPPNKTMLKRGGTTLNGGEGRGGGRWVLYLTDVWLAFQVKKGVFCQCFIMSASNVNKTPLHTFGCFCKRETKTKQDYNNYYSWPKGSHVGSQEQKHFLPLLHREYPHPLGVCHS